MATNFPSSQDNFTNPTSTSSLSSPSHSQQHSDVNDAVEAIELALLDGAPLHIDDANERIGVGTNNPSSKLEVADSVPTFTLRSSSTVPTANTELQAIDFYQSDASGGAGVSARIVGSASNSSGAQNIEFHTGQAGASSVAERMRIDSNGKVGIGTDSPATALEVAGPAAHIRITDSDTSGTTGIDFYDSDGTADVELEVGNSTQYFAIKTAGSEAMRIDSSGNLDVVSGELRIGGKAIGQATLFTPSFATGVTLGSAVTDCWHVTVGDVTFVSVDITLASNTQITGDVRFNLPVSATNTFELAANLQGNAYDGSSYYKLMGRAYNGTGVRVVAMNTSGSYAVAEFLSGSVPFGWGAGDRLTFSLYYRS